MRPARRAGAVLVSALLLLLAAAGAHADDDADPYGRVLDEFRRKMQGASVEKAAEAVRLLDPANPRSLPELLGVLAKAHWYVRGTAMDALASVPAGPLRAELRLHLLTDEDPWVREGVAFAMATGPVPGDADALVGALDDADWHVRRTAARALGAIVSKDGVARLVRAFTEETDLRVRVWVHASLRAVAGRDFGREPTIWREWWERNRDRPEWKAQGDEVVREEFAGVPLETFTVDTPAPSGGRSERPEVFVLAPFGYTHDWFRPTLDELSDSVRLTYVTLPTISELTGASGYGPSVPTYPVDRLAAALEDLREKHGAERVVVLASGPTAWIAERYAQRYAKRVAALLLVDGWLDRTAYGQALARLYAQGSASERWAAELLLGEVPTQHTPEEGLRLRRVFLTHALAEPRDSEAWRLWRTAARDTGFVTVPPLEFDRHTRIEIPTLFTFPGESPFGGGTADDLRRIRASFKKPPPVTAVLRDSRGFAHVEDPEEFLRVLRGFLGFAGVLK